MRLTPTTDLAPLLNLPVLIGGVRRGVIDWARHGADCREPALAGGVACTWVEHLPGGQRVSGGGFFDYGTDITVADNHEQQGERP